MPKLYAALTYLTGPSDNLHDDYKGSFSFLFELEVKKNSNVSKYFYLIYHYRSYIEFAIYQILPKSKRKRDTSRMRKPNPRLFSKEDIIYFSLAYSWHVLGCLKKSQHPPEPFVKYSDSNLLLFGYDKNGYFIEDYEDEEEYEEDKKKMEAKIHSMENRIALYDKQE